MVFLIGGYKYIYGGSMIEERNMKDLIKSANEAMATPAKTPVKFANHMQMLRKKEDDDELMKWATHRMQNYKTDDPDFDPDVDAKTLYNIMKHSQGTIGISELDTPQFNGAAYKVPLNSKYFGAAPHSANVTFGRLYNGITGEPRQTRKVNFETLDNYPERVRNETDPGRRFSNSAGFQKNEKQIWSDWGSFKP